MFHVTVVGLDSESCSKVTVPLTFDESPANDSDYEKSMFVSTSEG